MGRWSKMARRARPKSNSPVGSSPDRSWVQTKNSVEPGRYSQRSTALTLTEAYHVLHAELRWSPGDHIQADGRAWMRMNDPHNITAHYLVCAGTIDEVRMDVIDAKRIEMATVTDGDRMAIAAGSTFGDVLSVLLRRALGADK